MPYGDKDLRFNDLVSIEKSKWCPFWSNSKLNQESLRVSNSLRIFKGTWRVGSQVSPPGKPTHWTKYSLTSRLSSFPLLPIIFLFRLARIFSTWNSSFLGTSSFTILSPSTTPIMDSSDPAMEEIRTGYSIFNNQNDCEWYFRRIRYSLWKCECHTISLIRILHLFR